MGQSFEHKSGVRTGTASLLPHRSSLILPHPQSSSLTSQTPKLWAKYTSEDCAIGPENRLEHQIQLPYSNWKQAKAPDKVKII